ncbi:MAG: hypothetical protein U5K69_11085 [Balneolaceae bacterium]|nr:hypothetical protein [Balneolaceae bacterium]
MIGTRPLIRPLLSCRLPRLALRRTVFEVLVEILVGGISSAFGFPDPLVEGLMGDPIDPHHAPAAADQFRRKLLGGQPPAGLVFEDRR